MKSTKISVPFPPHYFDKKATADNVLICGIDEVGRGCIAGPVVVAAAMLKPSVLIETPMPFITDSKKMSALQREKAYAWLLVNSWHALASVSHREIDQGSIYKATLTAMQRAVAQLFAAIPHRPASIFVDAMPLELPRLRLSAPSRLRLSESSNSANFAGHAGSASYVGLTPSLCFSERHLYDKETENTLPNADENDPFTAPWGKIISFCHGEEQCLAIAAASIIAKVTRDRTLEQLDPVFPGYELTAHKGYATPTHKSLVTTRGLSLIHRESFCSFVNQTPSAPLQTSLFPLPMNIPYPQARGPLKIFSKRVKLKHSLQKRTH